MFNLERTNLAVLDRTRVPEIIELVTLDLSYVSVACAAGQLGAVEFAAQAELVALVKPTFELGLSGPGRARQADGELESETAYQGAAGRVSVDHPGSQDA